jgi:hypothetical protein
VSRFFYHASIPAEMRPLVESYFEPLAWMVPRWCERVNVMWSEASEEDTAMNTQAHFSYRFGEVTVYPCWLGLREEVKRNVVLHELIHLHLLPLHDYANNTLGKLLKDNEVFKAHAQGVLDEYHEGATQDLADVIQGRPTECSS